MRMSDKRPSPRRTTQGTARTNHAGANTRRIPSDGRRRPMTPEQRKRAIHRRRMRALRRNLKFIIPAAIILLAAIVLIIVTGGLRTDNSVSAMTNLQPAVMDESQITQAEDTMSEPDEAVTDVESDSNDMETSLETMPAAEPEPAQAEPLTTYYTGERFDYSSEYVRAVNGAVTGPDVQPRYTNVDPSKRERWPQPKTGNMPTLYKVEGMTEKEICVTVDDCFQAENLRKIVQAALDVNGKVTIFPIGANVAKESVGKVVKWAWENGMELENHTYNHVGLYHFEDKRMEQELWYQNCELNELLGVNYTQHFFRPHGGDERDDQRDHAYIQQLGMYGVAMWSDDGSKSQIGTLKKGLAPGKIYLFHTTDNDWSLLEEFIPYAASQGYKLVTLNEMYGLPANETSELTITKSVEPPALQPFKIEIPTLKKVTYMRAGAVVQERLIQLGWLKGAADGEYGAGSYEAVGKFQQAMGLDADGIAGPTTQAVLFSSDAKKK